MSLPERILVGSIIFVFALVIITATVLSVIQFAHHRRYDRVNRNINRIE